MNYIERLKVAPGRNVRLKDIDLDFKDHRENTKEAAEEINHYRTRLREL